MSWRSFVAVAAVVWTLGRAGLAFAQQEPDPLASQPQGAQVLTTGPVHEAFAEPVVYDPKPGPVVPKAPPQPIQELPPDQKPAGDNVQWIPGYWAWDEGRQDFLWVSGIWRDIPPGRQWTPGYWNQVPNGYQWVPGAWTPLSQGQAQYLPAPPPSLEAGPNTPPPSDNVVWMPGSWVWQNNQYLWQPGFWGPFQQNWTWMPAHYVWTPNGYLYVNGYWDYPFTQRGTMFAPVYFNQPIYSQPNFLYSPTIGLLGASLLSNLFVRPLYHQYYFGNYYAPSYFQSGIYPWYAFHQSRYGYDPLFSYYNAYYSRTDPRWSERLYHDYRYRVENPQARPPRTYAEQVRLERNLSGTNARNVVLARPVHQLAAASGTGIGPGAGGAQALRYERLDESRRQAHAQQATQLHAYRDERIRREGEAARARPTAEPHAPRTLEAPRSPIAAEGARVTPPPVPEHSRPERSVAPISRQEAQRLRPEPHPEARPVPHHSASPPGPTGERR
jgi:hypothetical protein